jgi:hypothetical protein
MTVHDELAPAGVAAPKDTPGTAMSWEGTSNEELMAIMSRGALAGDLFFSASAEMERRSRELDAAVQAEEERVVAKRQHMALLIAALFALGTILALKLTGRF